MENNLLTPEAMLNEIQDSIQEYSDVTFDEWFNNVFNGDPYIIGQAKANQNLMNYRSIQFDGPLAAARDAHIYLEKELGITDEVTVESFEPEQIAARLAYCIADFYTTQAMSDADLDMDDEVNDKNRKYFIEALQEYWATDWYNEINALQ